MKSLILLSGVAAAGLLLAPVAGAQQPRTRKQTQHMDADMQRAIEFQRAEDRAAERQARMEARHPTVSNSEANRLVEDQDTVRNGRTVHDPGEKQYRKDKH